MSVKHLFLLRHAKSDWEDDKLADHDRPLAPRGIKNMPAVAELILQFEHLPQLAYVSSALRTRQTYQLLAEQLKKNTQDRAVKIPQVKFLETLYATQIKTLYQILQGTPDDIESVLMVGHNPEMEDFVANLIGCATSGRIRMSTAAVAYLTFEVNHWRDLKHGQGQLQTFITGKILKALTKK